ncbi:MAG TPA: hypothetical protein VFU09_10100, partial [Candidatus Udaeobacter sp.]|nr:hypothetical protein [Candidatus Udaeobacter sp.]
RDDVIVLLQLGFGRETFPGLEQSEFAFVTAGYAQPLPFPVAFSLSPPCNLLRLGIVSVRFHQRAHV